MTWNPLGQSRGRKNVKGPQSSLPHKIILSTFQIKATDCYKDECLCRFPALQEEHLFVMLLIRHLSKQNKNLKINPGIHSECNLLQDDNYCV